MRQLPIFLLMTTLPTMVIVRSFREVSWHLPVGYILAISLITIGSNWHDKRQSKAGGQRISERALHLMELLGGWPAAYLAQQCLHHKTSKRSYRTIYWLIVALYQYASAESLLNGRIFETITGS